MAQGVGQLATPIDFSEWGLYNPRLGSGSETYVGDINGNGINEIVIGGKGETIHNLASIDIYEYKDAKYSIRSRFLLPRVAQSWGDENYGVNSLAGMYSAEDTAHFLFVAGAGRGIFFYNLTNKTFLGAIPDKKINKLLLKDLDKDGQLELIAVGETATLIIDIKTRAVKYEYPVGSTTAVIGDFTVSDTPGIAYANGEIYAFNGSTLDLLWSDEVLQGRVLAVNDVNEDGVDELIVADRKVSSFDVKTKSTIWSSPVDISAWALSIYDVNNDGVNDVLYGDEQWGSIHALNGATGAELWAVENPDWGVGHITVANLDIDATQELIWIGDSTLNIHDLFTQTQEFNMPSEGATHAYTVADIENDGHNEVAAVTTFGNAFVLNAENGQRKWKIESDNFWGSQHLKLFDTNNDGIKDLIFSAYSSDGAQVTVLNGANGSLLYRKVLGALSSIDALLVADLDNNGSSEIIVSHTATEATGDRLISIMNAADGNAIKQSPADTVHNAPVGANIDAADITGNQHLDVLGVRSQRVFLYDTFTNHLTTSTSTNISAAVFARSNNETKIFVGHSDGQLGVMGKDFVESPLHKICIGTINSLTRYGDSQILFFCDHVFQGLTFGSYDLVHNEVAWSYAIPINLNGWSRLQPEIHGALQFVLGGDDLHFFKLPHLSLVDKTFDTHFKRKLNGEVALSTQREQFLLQAPPEFGVVELDEMTGEFEYSPKGTYVGPIEFFVVAQYAGLKSNVAKVTINLVNNFPVPSSETYSVRVGQQELIGQLKAVDADGDSFTFHIIKAPVYGHISVNEETGVFTYNPPTEGSFEDSFEYIANDGVYSPTQAKGVIKIAAKNSSTDKGGGSGGGGNMSLLLLMLLGSLGICKIFLALPRKTPAFN